MSYYYEEYDVSPYHYVPEFENEQEGPIYYDPQIYDNPSLDTYSLGLDSDMGYEPDLETPLFYNPYIYDTMEQLRQDSESLLDDPTHWEPIEMSDVDETPQAQELQYEPEQDGLQGLSRHRIEWNLLENLLQQMEEPPPTHDHILDDKEWELAIAHDHEVFEARKDEAFSLLAIYHMAEAWHKQSQQYSCPQPPYIKQLKPLRYDDPPYRQHQMRPHRKHPPPRLPLHVPSTSVVHQINAIHHISQKAARHARLGG
ncbi:hypothetical protein BJ912DRAFT_950493 [Pholiota molesta]|nr:hypothetical protein BJ912DRAFT_950493 [Pholiota molesta]